MDSESDIETIAVTAAPLVAVSVEQKRKKLLTKKKPKRVWVKDWILKFGTNGDYENGVEGI